MFGIGGFLNRLWWGGDPDELHSLTGLSRRDVYYVCCCSLKSNPTLPARATTAKQQTRIRLTVNDPISPQSPAWSLMGKFPKYWGRLTDQQWMSCGGQTTVAPDFRITPAIMKAYPGPRSNRFVDNWDYNFDDYYLVILFRADPETKTFFKTIQHMDEDELSKSFQFRAHAINLMTSINTAIVNLHQPEVVMALMNKLGESHHKRHVKVEHFEEVKSVLVDILESELDVHQAVLVSWGRFVDFIYKYIFEKMTDKPD